MDIKDKENSNILHNLNTKMLKKLLAWKTNDTKQLTQKIKLFYKNEFKKHFVYFTKNNQEFLYDITISQYSLESEPNSVTKNNLFLVLESELGGSGASSSKGLLRNVIYDFQKLLFCTSENRVLIAAYSEQEPYIYINKLFKFYKYSPNKKPILVILIHGYHNRRKNSRQIKLEIKKETMYSYLLENKKITKL